MTSTYGYTTAAKVKSRIKNYQTAISDAEIDTFINHAEGYITAITKKIFKGTIPPLVEMMATDLAAMYLLAYDPSGMSSTSEAALTADIIFSTLALSMTMLSDDRKVETISTLA